MKDIESRQDIETLVDAFYKKVRKDNIIGHFFTQIVELDWDKHMPIMYDFWETTLLGNLKYRGNPMTKHFDLNRKQSLKTEHFDRWLMLWGETIKENFSGEMADESIQRATQIAGLMKFKMEQLK